MSEDADLKPKIWIDADACPRQAKEIVYRAANRTQTEAVLVANRALAVPPSPCIRVVCVPGGFDEADKAIAAQARAGDLVVTSDLPLADELVGKGCVVRSPRGEVFDAQNVKAAVQMRDFMETMRSSGMAAGGPPPYSDRDAKAFAGELDKWLSAASKSRQKRPAG